MEYKGIIKKRKTWLTVLFVILACLMLWRTIVTQHWSYLPIVILVILACFFTKEQIISQDGVDIQYTLFGRWTMHNLWTWDEITSLHPDYIKRAPNFELLTARDVVIRPFVMTREDTSHVLELAKKMNTSIIID